MTSKSLVLVTGASGFLGAQIVEHLLQAGYSVRGTSRSAKADHLRKNYNNPDFDVTIIDDLMRGDFSAALKGVDSVIHVASPVASGNNHIQVAVDGTMNLLRQAHKAQVHKIIVVSSVASTFTIPAEMLDPDRVITDRDWNQVTKEQALQPDASSFRVYAASKVLAERAAWDFIESHPEMDLITILPPFFYGPLADAQVVIDPETSLSTDGWLYMLIAGPAAAYPPDVFPQFVDVRDVAKAAVLSLKAERAQSGEKRRVLLCGGSFTWKQAAKHIATVRPELKPRLVDSGEAEAETKVSVATIDNGKAKALLGMTEFIGWKQTVEDTIDSLLKREALWIN